MSPRFSELVGTESHHAQTSRKILHVTPVPLSGILELDGERRRSEMFWFAAAATAAFAFFAMWKAAS